jgi:adenine-specific DNA-methyltransferase
LSYVNFQVRIGLQSDKAEMRRKHQHLPPSGAAREALREKGQFWTPQWVAEAMVSYVLGAGSNHIFDPAVGAGAFFKAAKTLALAQGRTIKLLGTEIDPVSQEAALAAGLSSRDLVNVEIRDFVAQPPERRFSAIVANPPYIRHHRLPKETKTFLRHFGASLIGKPLDGRAGYHVYFFLRGLQLLSEGGRLAFIMPADVCEGVFATTLWRWLLGKYRLDAVITFSPEATPFPAVDTNAIVFMLCDEKPKDTFIWAKCTRPDTPALRQWVESRYRKNVSDVQVFRRSVKEALHTGLSRPPSEFVHSGPILGDFAFVLRGIATGANEFFFLTQDRARELHIPAQWLIPAVGRTRDVPDEIITTDTVRELQAAGRPTLLLSLDATRHEDFPDSLRQYLTHGEHLGLHKRSLIASRRPWYKMEVRATPAFLFAYLGRRNARFIRNLAGVVPLTGFLCVYALRSDAEFLDKLWNVLRDEETIANLSLVGKSYGAGAIKVEPRALERLPIPMTALQRWGLEWKPASTQLELAIGA